MPVLSPPCWLGPLARPPSREAGSSTAASRSQDRARKRHSHLKQQERVETPQRKAATEQRQANRSFDRALPLFFSSQPATRWRPSLQCRCRAPCRATAAHSSAIGTSRRRASTAALTASAAVSAPVSRRSAAACATNAAASRSWDHQ